MILVAVVLPVRRIGENQVVTCSITFKESGDVRLHGVTATESGFGQIFGDGGDCLAVVIDKRARGGTSAQCLKAERARAGKKVEHLCLFKPLTEDRKDRLADKVRGRACDG